MRKLIMGFSVILAVWSMARGTTDPDSPFLNQKSVVFARVQTDRIDAGEIEKFILESVAPAAATKPADFAQFQTSLQKSMAEMIRWLGEFKEARGHEIDVIGQSDSFEARGGAVLVPLAAGANAEQIASLLRFGHKNAPPPPAAPERVQAFEARTEIVPDKAVLYAPKSVRDEFKAMVPAPAPNIAAAISSSGDAPISMVFAPDTVLRAHLLRNLPPMILTQPTRPIVEGVDWIVEFATVPPHPTLHLIIQCKDGTIAGQIASLANLGLGFLMADSDLGDISNRAALVKLLTPQVKANQVTVDLDTPHVAELMRALEPSFIAAQQQALRVKSMSNMRQILQGCVIYSNDHKGEWPDKLDEIAKYFGGKDQMAAVLTNPQDPTRHPAFIYMKPKQPVAMPSQQMVLYESHDTFAPGVHVGFADGHIEFISSPQRFKDLLLQAYQEAWPDQ